MRRVIALALVLSLALPFGAFAEAPQSIRVELDGFVLRLEADSVPRIVNGRALVPLRALSERLGAAVDYSETTQTVTLTTTERVIEFPLERPVMYIDGSPIEIDVPAQAFSGRSFIPVRRFAEALGCDVVWDENKRLVVVRTPPLRRELIGNYWGNSYAQFLTYGHELHRAMVRWSKLALTEAGVQLLRDYPIGHRVVPEELAPERGVHLSLQIYSGDMSVLAPLLNSVDQQVAVIEEAVSIVRELGFSGINLDLEEISSSRHEQALTNFVRLMATRCREEGLHLSMYVHAKSPTTPWLAYNYSALHPHVDQLIIMAHDLRTESSAPGAHSPINWAENVLRSALDEAKVPREKLVLAVSLHGINWPASGGRGTRQGLNVFTPEWLHERSLTSLPLDLATGMARAEYTSPNDGERILWTETAESIQLKVNLVQKYNIAGLSFWRLGMASPDLFAEGGPFHGFR